MKTLLTALLLLIGLTAQARADEPVRLNAKFLKDVDVTMFGFLQADVIYNSRQFLTDGQASEAPPKMTTPAGNPNYPGTHGRTVMSVRNSRIGFDLKLPKTDSGLQAKMMMELDFNSNQAENQPPVSSLPTSNTERDFFQNPSIRIRHLVLNLTKNEWNVKFGQYWSLLGWKPYYFTPETLVQAGPAQIYRRFPQNRFTYAHPLNPEWLLESAVGYARPAQMNSEIPLVQGGLRLSSKGRLAGYKTGAASEMAGLSAAVSADAINLRTAVGSASGQTVTFDVGVPVLASSDGKDVSNTLIVLGEFTTGAGMGGLEYPGLTGGVKAINVASVNADSTTIDSGMAGINEGGRAELIRFRIFRIDAQYHLNPQWAASVGYGQIEGRNLDRFSRSAGQDPTAITPKIQTGYLNIFYDPYRWLRFVGGVNQTVATYNDAANRTAINNHYQFTTNFIF